MQITLKQLEVFRAVVVSGSITKASRRLGLSQPTVSQQVAKLEETLGAQLMKRNRTGTIELTPAGEFWFKNASELTKRLDTIIMDHEAQFGHGNLAVRLGTTPTLRGRFAAALARIVLEESEVARFDLSWGINSDEVVNQLRLHQINFAIVNAVAIEEDHSSNVVTPIYHDRIAWVVPDEIPESAMVVALSGDEAPFAAYPALERHATIGPNAPMQPATDNWYRNYMPTSAPVFGTMTYLTAVELVAEGLCTSHCPLSLLPNLPTSVSSRLRWYKIPDFGRDIVLTVPKHLLSLRPYARVHTRICEFFTNEYRTEMATPEVRDFSDLVKKSGRPLIAAE